MDESAHPIDEQLRQLVVDEDRSFAETARILGVSRDRVTCRARTLGIVSSHTSVKRPQLHDADWLRAQFDDGRTITDVAAELGVNYGTVVTARRRHGIAPSRSPKRPIDAAEVQRRLDAGESLSAIGRALGHSSSAISKVVKRTSAVE